MNWTIRDILCFGMGFGAGVYMMHAMFQKKYRDYYDERYETERQHLREREADMDSMRISSNALYSLARTRQSASRMQNLA